MERFLVFERRAGRTNERHRLIVPPLPREAFGGQEGRGSEGPRRGQGGGEGSGGQAHSGAAPINDGPVRAGPGRDGG